jgi:hypothetical protein
MGVTDEQQLSLLAEFQREAEARGRERRFELEDAIRLDRQRRDERRDRKRREYIDALVAMDRVNDAQIAAFRERLDRYDTVTVEALMENQNALDEVHGKIEAMRAQAYSLPDGRKVFKTTDGRRVFDENGAAISKETLDPDAIEDGRPKWEAIKTQLDARQQLEAERGELLQFQVRADQARERAGQDGLSGKELDAIGVELDQAMPEAVRQKLAAQGHHAGAGMGAPPTDQLSAAAGAPADRLRRAAEDFSPAR